jgi:Na+-driven multidrug efflux pump
MVLLSIFGGIILINPEPYILFFIKDPGVVLAGTAGLKILSIGFISYGLGMVIINSFNGAGDTVTPTWINFFIFWLFEIPLAAFLSNVLFHNEKGVFIAIVIAESAMTLVAWLIFRKGKWKLNEV